MKRPEEVDTSSPFAFDNSLYQKQQQHQLIVRRDFFLARLPLSQR